MQSLRPPMNSANSRSPRRLQRVSDLCAVLQHARTNPSPIPIPARWPIRREAPCTRVDRAT